MAYDQLCHLSSPRRPSCSDRDLGWPSLPAVLKDTSSDESFVAGVVENIQRNTEIDPLVEAKGNAKLIEHGWTVNAIAAKIGRSDSYVSDRVSLIKRLHPEIASQYSRENKSRVKPSHLEALARIKSKTQQLELAELVQRKRLSVRQLERLISHCQPIKAEVEGKADFTYVRIPPVIALAMGLEPGVPLDLVMQTRDKLTLEKSVRRDDRGCIE